jgi:hypothetical protein
MPTEPIIEDFLDYRAYVSHTLCKHRLFLGLETADEARQRLSDACVWPLVAIEAERLFELAGTLYGMRSQSLESTRRDVQEVLKRMREDATTLLSGNKSAFKAFRASADALNDLLTSLSRQFDRQTPEFSATRVAGYLKGRTAEDCLDELATTMRERVAPEVAAILGGGAAVADAYKRFWLASSDAFLLSRCAQVAGASRGFDSGQEDGINDLRRRLRRIERILSCWSPGILESDRKRVLEQTLAAEGYTSAKAVLMEVEALGR